MRDGGGRGRTIDYEDSFVQEQHAWRRPELIWDPSQSKGWEQICEIGWRTVCTIFARAMVLYSCEEKVLTCQEDGGVKWDGPDQMKVYQG
jgi:hypothetical protein